MMEPIMLVGKVKQMGDSIQSEIEESLTLFLMKK